VVWTPSISSLLILLIVRQTTYHKPDLLRQRAFPASAAAWGKRRQGGIRLKEVGRPNAEKISSEILGPLSVIVIFHMCF